MYTPGNGSPPQDVPLSLAVSEDGIPRHLCISPVEHVVVHERRTTRPVMLVEHVLERGACQLRARVVPWSAPRVERASCKYDVKYSTPVNTQQEEGVPWKSGI